MTDNLKARDASASTFKGHGYAPTCVFSLVSLTHQHALLRALVSGGMNSGIVATMYSKHLADNEIRMLQQFVQVWDGHSWDLFHSFETSSHHNPTRISVKLPALDHR